MTDTPFSVSSNMLHIQTELFRPSLQYPSHSYAEILSKTAERYPENEAVIFSAPIRLANDAGASELSRSDNEATASTAAQSIRTSGVRFSFRQDEREGEYLSYHVKCGRYRRTAVCISSRRWTASSTVCEA